VYSFVVCVAVMVDVAAVVVVVDGAIAVMEVAAADVAVGGVAEEELLRLH
jgi:hypothetical protein